jgi:5-methylthioadenosine/S-adenosylhomocysteine deaminase
VTRFLLRAAHLLPGGGALPQAPGLLLIEGDRILGLGPEVAGAEAETLDLGATVLMPGFVNAHQHGRGLPQAVMGYPDDVLEAWVNRRRRRGTPEAYPLVHLAALRLLAKGVTACLHANWAHGGDLHDELDATLRAYEEAGIRAAVMIGVADRGALVYPGLADEAAFLAALAPPLRALAETLRAHPYPATVDAAAALFDRLAARWGGHDRLSLGFGPAGPQWVSDGLFAGIAGAARARDAALHFHLLESPAQARACAALYPEGTLRRLASLGALGPFASAAHGVFLAADDMAVMAAHGVTLVANPGSNLRLGNGLPDYAAMRAAGVNLALGGDDCELQDDRDPWAELRLVTTAAGGPAPLPAAERLAIATENGARALRQERIGRLLPGWRADVIALDPAPAAGAWHDPEMPLDHLLLARATGREVRMTMVAGRVVYRDGAFPHLGADALSRAEAAAIATARAARRHPARDPAEVEALGRAILAAHDPG